MLSYTKATVISLKGRPELDEKWLSDRIEEDPTILGLGELHLLERERRREKAG
jgi:hypothetical protein